MLKFAKQDNRERLDKEIKQQYEEALAAARECLDTEEFSHYRQQYELLEKRLIEQLIQIDNTEKHPLLYGFAVKGIIADYKAAGALLRAVEQGAGKRI